MPATGHPGSTGRFREAVQPLWVYALIVPLAVIQLTMRARWPDLQNLVQDGANVAHHGVLLLCGFLLARFPALERTAQAERRRALAIALAAALVLLLGVVGAVQSPSVLLVHSAVAGWCFVLAILGGARKSLSFTTPTLPFHGESAWTRPSPACLLRGPGDSSHDGGLSLTAFTRPAPRVNTRDTMTREDHRRRTSHPVERDDARRGVVVMTREGSRG